MYYSFIFFLFHKYQSYTIHVPVIYTIHIKFKNVKFQMSS